MKSVHKTAHITVENSHMKHIGMIVLLLLYCYLQYKITNHAGGDMATLFQGAPPGAQAYNFLVFYFGFTIPSFLIYAKATDYSSGYGPLLASRHRTRAVLVHISLRKVAKMLLSFEALKIMLYGLIVLLGTGFHLPQINFMFFYFCFWDFVTLLFFLGLQTLVELLTSPQIALLATHGSFLFTLAASDILMASRPSWRINALLPMNHQMGGRFTHLPGDFYFNLIALVLATCLGGAILYAVGLRLFKRKDLI